MIATSPNSILDGSHYARNTANRFQFVVIENKPCKGIRRKRNKNVVTKAILTAVNVGYFVLTIPEILSLIYRLKVVDKKIKKSMNKDSFIVTDHLSYTMVRSRVDSLRADIASIKSMRSDLSGRIFPLKSIVLKELSNTIAFMDNYVNDVDKYLRAFNKPVLQKFGNKVLTESKHWNSRVKAYDFIA